MGEMTPEQAIALAETGWWKDLPPDVVVAFQLFEELLCMDFRDYHAAVEAALGRGVYTHEFAWPDRLREEFLGMRPRATLGEILALLPAERTVVVVMPEVTP